MRMVKRLLEQCSRTSRFGYFPDTHRLRSSVPYRCAAVLQPGLRNVRLRRDNRHPRSTGVRAQSTPKATVVMFEATDGLTQETAFQ